ncbi:MULTISPECIES: hypothetical protein [Legionella]|uniref:Uncharacterized protein n=1 Tax=Legionella drozanskii LLAP-1 TaxID=1212489 RepID=A0A0W0SME3_9GAMM|nr:MULTISPECIES: hypothetical protein [Legionella]KTC84433.1 hypothetical protein Ldro_3036 [Legionella drozanskii LLAP-1]PJE05785.1 MAG: hypothetical protein CK430_15340 [Legionella sp.]
MQKIIFCLLISLTPFVASSPIILKDTECKLISGIDVLNVLEGDISTTKCNKFGNILSCNYFDVNGKKFNDTETYLILDDNENMAVWKSEAGNVLISLNYTTSQFQMGTTRLAYRNGILLIINKNCVGKILSH